MLLIIALIISTLSSYSVLSVFAEGDEDSGNSDEPVSSSEGTGSEDSAEDSGETGEDAEENVDKVSYEVKVNRYLNNDYWTPEDKITLDVNMKKRITQDGYSLYVNDMTGEVVIKDEESGQYLFSNPYDIGTISASNSTKQKLLSQIIVNYIDNGTDKTFNSFTEAALRNQIKVKNIKGGVRIEYSIGREEGRVLVPRMISAERFENIFLNTFKGVKADREEFYDNDKDQYENDSIWFECDRFLNFFVKKDTNDPSLSTRAVKEMIAKYPIVRSMAIYATSEDIQDKELNYLESCIKKYVPTYSYEDLDTDHSITNYVGNDKPPALFRMALEYTLDDDGVKVRLPAKGLRYDATNYTLEGISVLPYMGAGSYENNGYTFLPDGSGALFRFEDFAGKSVTITSKMYGQDYGYYKIGEAHREVMRLPVFGVCESVDKEYEITISPEVKDERGLVVEEAVIEHHTYAEDRGFLAIIEAGDAIASLTTEHGGSLHSYCTAYTSFNPRPSDEYDIADAVKAASHSMWTVTSDRKYVGDITLRYIMLNGGDNTSKSSDGKKQYSNDYVGMATAYRDFLEKKGTLQKLEKSSVGDSIPLYIESFGSIETLERILSVPVTVKKALTTFEDIKTMYDELSEKGITNVNFKLTGFANGGLHHTGPVKVDWEGSAGGDGGFRDLIKYAEEKHFGVYPDFEFTEVNLGGGFSKDYLVKTINGRYTVKSSYDSTYQTFMPYGGMVVSAASYPEIFKRFSSAYSRFGWDSVSVSNLSSDLSTDFDKEDPYNREDAKVFTVQMLESLQEAYPNVMGVGGNIYSVKYLKHILNVPIDSSRYTLSSDTIPFIGMVYHGYVNFAGSPINQAGDYEYMFLKTIENGANLYFTLSRSNTQLLKDTFEYSKYYSVRYEIWFDQLVESYNELNGIMADLQTETIVKHEFLIGERVPDEDEVEADKAAEEKAAAELQEAIDAYELKLEKAINFAKRKGTYNDKFEEKFKAKYYPIKEEEPDEDQEEPEYNYTKYTNDDGSIVRVTYSNGTSFILNYNNFEVEVDVDGTLIRIPAYSFK